MINVLIVDDDAMVADLNRLYVNRVEGFSCCGVASTLSQAEAIINNPSQPVDLVLLDVYMQQDNGLDLLVDYLIKPFQFPRFEEALNGWKAKHSLMGSHQYYEQADVDRLIHGGAPELADSKKLPKGLTPQTLRTICQWIDAHPETEFSTDDLANAVNISRVSCRKYLIWLAQINILFTSIHYGATGRPVYRYRLQPEQTGLLKQYCQ